LERILWNLLGDLDNRLIVLARPRVLEARAQCLQSKLLQATATRSAIDLEVLQKRLLALLLQVPRLVRVRDVPAFLGLGDQPRVALVQPR
jgi:hypothetical protein